MLQTIRNVIANLSTKSAGIPLSSASAYELFGPVSPSGLSITPENALRVPAIGQGVRLIAESVASLSPAVYREIGDGRETLIDHPVARVMRRPNGWTGGAEFVRQAIADMILHGNAMALIVRVQGEPREAHRVDPRVCTITVDPISGEPSYTIAMAAGGTREFSWRDVLHLRSLSVDGTRGLGLVEIGRQTIELCLALENHGAAMFRNGARPSGILELAGRVDQSMLERLRASFTSIYSGGENAGKTVILESGVKFQAMQLASTDAQFLENRKFQIGEVSRLLNIPPILLGDLQSATFSNAESLAQAFLDRTIAPLLEIFEDALERALLTDEERDSGLSIEFDTGAFARADTAARFAAYRQAIEIGLFTVNEARAAEGLSPVAGGDQPMRSVQTLPLDPAAAPPPKKDAPA